MANRVSQYTIELDIAQGDKTRATIDGIERGLREISDAAKGDALSGGLAAADRAAQGLERTINAIAASGEDATQEMAAYDRAASRAIGDLERQATALNHALSEQGKAQRARIEEITRELSALEKTKGNAERRKALESELKALKKAVVQGSDEELRAALAQNKTIRARLRMAQESAKLRRVETKEQKGLAALVKADIAAMKERLREQFKFISALKTTEGRYAALKKAAGAIGVGAKRLAGGAAKAAAIGGGLMLGIAGAAVAGAGAEVDRQNEARRIKAGGLSDDDKRDLMSQVYINTGADYTTIVDAINRVYGVIGNAKKEDLVEAATAEVQTPGAAALFRQQTTGAATSADFTDYSARLRAVQSATGATAEQIQAASGVVANMPQSRLASASQTEMQALYLALQNSGAFDTQEELDAAFARFTRAQSASGADLFEMAKTWDWGRGASATNRQQASAAMASVDWSRIAGAARETGFTTESAADATARKMREFELKKDELLMRLLPAVIPVVEKISDLLNSPAGKKIINGIVKLFESVIPILEPIFEVLGVVMGFLNDFIIKPLKDMIQAIMDWLEDEPVVETASRVGESVSAVSAMPRANGGVVSMPSLVGERGPEAVIPLDYSRSARAGNIMQNISQTFNMKGNETTTLSLANAVKSRGFQRALGNASALNTRLGR